MVSESTHTPPTEGHWKFLGGGGGGVLKAELLEEIYNPSRRNDGNAI